MKTDLLLHPETEKLLTTFLANPTHSLLLSGPKNNGKTLLAADIAAQLLGCRVVALAYSGQVRRLTPQDGKISVESARSLAAFVRLKTPGKTEVSRVILIEDADTLTREAQNSLLKLLEEPPAHTVLILTSSAPRLLLPTIRSRVQHVIVRAPKSEKIAAYLAAKGYAESDIEKARLLGGGGVGATLQLLESGDQSFVLLDVVRQALSSDVFTRLGFIDAKLKDKETARSFVKLLSVVSLSAVHKGVNVERWQRVATAAYDAQKALHANANQKLVLTELMLSV